MKKISCRTKLLSNNHDKNPACSPGGFTIIEVLIVLAIAGLILAIIFLTISTLNRRSRNFSTQHAVDYSAAQLDQYYADNGHLPTTVAEGAVFENNYLSNFSKQYTFDFRDVSGAHDYVPPLGTIAIEYGHWCNRYGNGDAPSDPIAGTDSILSKYVVWSEQETGSGQSTYCIDNYGQ